MHPQRVSILSITTEPVLMLEIPAPQWPYSGKRYTQMFPLIHSSNHAPPMPGPPFDEDPAAVTTRGYNMMYTYAPYPYQGQVCVPSVQPFSLLRAHISG